MHPEQLGTGGPDGVRRLPEVDPALAGIIHPAVDLAVDVHFADVGREIALSPTVPTDDGARVPEDLFGSWGPTLSPDAARVAFVSDRSGRPEVWIRSMEGGPPVLVPVADRRVTVVTWSPTGGWLACLVAPPGASRTEVWVVRPDGSGAHLIAGAAPATAVIASGRSRGWTADGHLVVTETDARSRVLLVDPDGGSQVVLADADVPAPSEVGLEGAPTFGDRALLHAVDVTPDCRRILLRVGPRGARELVVFDLGDPPSDRRVMARPSGGSTDLGCLTPDGMTVLARTDADRDRAELITATIGAHVATSSIGRPDGELEDIALSDDGSVAALTWNVGGGTSALTLLEVAAGHQHAVDPLPRPVIDGCALSPDGSQLVLTAEGPADPRGVWSLDVAATLADAGAGTVALVPLSSPGRGALVASRGATAASIDPARIVVPDLIGLRSPDGTPIDGWLYRPATGGPFPTLIWLHGGPEAQARPVYNSLFQSLLAAGIAVFAPNVRGSTGHGRAYRHADDGARRYGAFEDVAACAAHLVDIGVAQPGRIGVSGRSYGGYLALAALVRYPDLFAVGVDVSGMSDLQTFYEHTEPWIAAAAVTKYGDPVADRDLLRDLSPIHAVDQIRAPLLIVHGADDTNVPLTEATQLAAALDALGLPHRLLVFEDEGHDLLSTPNRVTFVHAVVTWVASHLDL